MNTTGENIGNDTVALLDVLTSLAIGRAPDHKYVLALAKYKDMPQLTKPTDYHEKVQLIRGYKKKDPIFGQLMGMMKNFIADGHDWEVTSKSAENVSVKDRPNTKKKSASEKEEEIWRNWDIKLNLPLSNILPGTDQVDDWIIDDLLTGGMCGLTWKYGKVGFTEDNRFRNYEMPIIMVNHPQESIYLRRGTEWYDPEEFYTKRPVSNTQQDIKRTEHDAIPTADTSQGTISKTDYMFHPKIGSSGDFGSFVLKVNWSPGGVTIVDGNGTFTSYLGLYPDPPYEYCIPWLLAREALLASDIQILDGLINYILAWIIGDESNPPFAERKKADGTVIPSDFATIKKVLTDQKARKILETFLPHWVKPEFITPPSDTLLSAEKYLQATVNLLVGFGIFAFDGVDLGTTVLEQNINSYRNKVLVPFWDMVGWDIVSRNKDSLTSSPNRRYNPLPFKRSDTLVTAIQKSHEQGEVSTETVLRVFGLDPDVERTRVVKEFIRGDREVYDAQVPVQFSQTVAKDTTGTKQAKTVDAKKVGTKETIVSTTPRGRPTGTKKGVKVPDGTTGK